MHDLSGGTLTFAVFLALVGPAADPDSRMRDWDFPSLRARRGGTASPLIDASPVTGDSWTAGSLGCAFAFSFSFSLSCSFTRSLSFSDLATSLRGRIRSAMEAFLDRPSWLGSDFKPRFFLSVKKSPSFLLNVLVGCGQGMELAGATSCRAMGSSSCLLLHKEPTSNLSSSFSLNICAGCDTHGASAGSTFFVKNSSTPSSTRPMSSRTSFSLSIIVS